MLSFPHNPTTVCVDREFFEEIVPMARRNGWLVVHDFAYAYLVYDGYTAPSILQIPGASEVAVENVLDVKKLLDGGMARSDSA